MGRSIYGVSRRMGEIKIVWTELGLADRIKDEILLNEALKSPKYNDIRNHILLHEAQHSGKLTAKDIAHDFNLKNNWKMTFKIIGFALEHPKTWTQMLPFRYHNGKRYWDVSQIIVMIISIGYLLFLNWVFYG